MANQSILFSSIKYVVHVPSLQIQKMLDPQVFKKEVSFIFHPYSMSFIEASLQEAEIIKLLEEGVPLNKIKELYGADSLRVINEVEEIIKDLYPKEIIKFNKPTVLWLLTSPFCNLRCRYCYTASGSAFWSSSRILNIDELVKAVEKILDAFPTIKHIAFFGGGEPLLRLDIIKVITEKFENNIEIFSITTNGTLINNDIIEFIENYKNKFILTLSIDGPRIVNDINRIYPDGRGTFNDIVKGIELLKEHGLMFDIQATYTREAFMLGYSMSDIAYFLSRFSPYIMLRPSDYVATLGAGERFEDAMLGFMLADYVDKSIMEMLKRDPTYYDLVIAMNIAQIGRRVIKLQACPYTSFITLNADGRIYTCHMLTDFVIGNILKTSKKDIKEKYEKALKILDIYTQKLDPRLFWMLTMQDICPAELYGGLSYVSKGGNKKLGLRPYIRSVLENYWDALLVKIFSSARNGDLDRLYENVGKMLMARRQGREGLSRLVNAY